MPIAKRYELWSKACSQYQRQHSMLFDVKESGTNTLHSEGYYFPRIHSNQTNISLFGHRLLFCARGRICEKVFGANCEGENVKNITSCILLTMRTTCEIANGKGLHIPRLVWLPLKNPRLCSHSKRCSTKKERKMLISKWKLCGSCVVKKTPVFRAWVKG